jgi:hypothetical protein
MKLPIKIIIKIIAPIVIGILIYQSPDEAYWLKENSKDAIEIGRTYALFLLNGYKQGLLEMSIDPAKAKIEKSKFREIAKTDIYYQLENKKINTEIIAPLFQGEESQDMELIMLEKLESFVVMTYAYTGWDRIVEIQDKGKMLFSIGVRYFNPIEDNRILPKLFRKLANLPLLRKFTGRLGTKGQWLVFDYNYKYNLSDYFDWVLKEGENNSQKKLKESEEFARKLGNKESFDKFRIEIFESTDIGLEFCYEWGSMRVEKQIELFEGLYKSQQNVEKNSKLKLQ